VAESRFAANPEPLANGREQAFPSLWRTTSRHHSRPCWPAAA